MTNSKPPDDAAAVSGLFAYARSPAAIVISLVLLSWFVLSWWTPSTSQLVTEVRRALVTGRMEKAASDVETLLKRAPDSLDVQMLAAKVAIETGEFEAALAHLQMIPSDGSDAAVFADRAIGDLLQSQLGRPTEALAHFQRLLKDNPEDVLANHRVAYLLGLGGRYRDAIPHRLTLLRNGQTEAVSLYLLCAGDTVLENVEQLNDETDSRPRDPLVNLGRARQAIDGQKHALAIRLLKEVIALHPEWSTAQALLGRQLLETSYVDAFRRWHHELPNNADANPEIWNLRGDWARQHNQSLASIRCFLESVKRDPVDQHANWQLGQLLTANGQQLEAQRFLRRSRLLDEMFDAVTTTMNGHDLEAARRVSTLADQLGLTWEAYGWARLVLDEKPTAEWAQETVERLSPQLSKLPLQRCVSETDLTANLNVADFDLPRIPTPEGEMLQDASSETIAEEELSFSFADAVAEAGLNFQYDNGHPVGQATRRMYEFNGGGVAVIDFDRDGNADLFLPQGCQWPAGSAESPHSDRLFRNNGRLKFSDVSAVAGVLDHDFSAGATAGDFNNDGWPDIYITNIGHNRMLHNNGDGTWTDVTAESGTAGNDWSTSSVIADLNGDTHPDLYVVNYLSGSDVFERLCPDEDGIARSCSPRDFPAAQDRLYINTGDGHFRDDTETSGITIPDGKGLGIVAADFSNTGRNNIFVANDAVPNFYFVNEVNSNGNPPQFTEQALSSGLAMNAEGQSEACMGIAVGDVNRDGRIDLFTTNFHNESNTLYQQQDSGIFADATRSSKLHAPSLKLLGFGTQFFDADLDGVQDLFVANGHIDDLRDQGLPYQMPAQCFRGQIDGTFATLSPDTLGPYFAETHLGRGLAKLDWNNDGLPDAVVTHLDAPTALLTNTTRTENGFLKVRLTGLASSRDAIGATVTLTTGTHRAVQQLTAGDGFQSSNERELIFGLGSAATIDELHVRWPSGHEQKLRQLKPNQRLHLIEGRPE